MTAAASDRYDSVKKLIYRECCRAQAFIRTDYDELLSEAYLVFDKATKTFDESKGVRFSTWLTLKLRSMFRDIYKRPRRRVRKIYYMPIDWFVGQPVSDYRERVMSHLRESLTEDAMAVVELALHPKTVEIADCRVRNHRRILQTAFQQRGWPPERLEKAYNNIRASLRSTC